MYSILDFERDGSVLRFTYATLGLEEHEWHHTSPVEPLLGWFENELLPLARRSGKSLTTDEILDCVSSLAARDLVPVTGVDWLGLALLAAQFYRECAGRLASEDSPELQYECSTAAVLKTLLTQLAEQRSQAIYERFAALSQPAADLAG
jgi:hypothetical protein